MIILKHNIFIRINNGEEKIEIRIYKPLQLLHSWGCKYEIDWPEGQYSITAQGEDALQSLTIALQMIGADLYTSTYHQEGSLRAYDSEEGYGFPVPNNLRDLLIGVDKMSF
ncbi:DUF6968 family protein [Xanthobacter oligotrophicus]|uniref:DUF6968 family protein n=1 Tax=Xanthobacter oligotrophicus TaxID=2607286 RepID=UPI0011F2F5A2|nr:hypothetical protein [Xanthobacter oligotrophicus]MCG5234411.1 hypothetical protein [Xanthobacter oligotrophicus]